MGAVRSARQRWRERESATNWLKQPLCVMVRGWVFRREKGSVMSYGQKCDDMSVFPQGKRVVSWLGLPVHLKCYSFITAKEFRT